MPKSKKLEQKDAPSKSLFGIIATIAFNPGSLISDHLKDAKVTNTLLVSGLAFTLFFLQTGLDIGHNKQLSPILIAALTAAGFIYGTLGIVLIGAFAWAGTKAFGGTSAIGNMIKSFALAYSPALIYAVLGLVFNLVFGWHTSIAFGVTGVLWALSPMINILKNSVQGRIWPAAILATFCGLIVIIGWAQIGKLL